MILRILNVWEKIEYISSNLTFFNLNNVLHRTSKLSTHSTQLVLTQTIPEDSIKDLQLNDRSVGLPMLQLNDRTIGLPMLQLNDRTIGLPMLQLNDRSVGLSMDLILHSMIRVKKL